MHEYASPKEAYRQLADYIRFYNFQRPHQALDYLTPAQRFAEGRCSVPLQIAPQPVIY
ncbi:MAG: integrase core domain-containing protein [Ignavibacterium sp.]|nr:integrase core domain-containing protein [Ignavibacterium sp.]